MLALPADYLNILAVFAPLLSNAAFGPIVVGIDDTIERRRSAKIKTRGLCRDATSLESWASGEKE